jgi:hypothetical protein
MATRLTYRQRYERKLPRLIKFGRQWLSWAATRRRPDTRIVFVVGSQRSGTRLPLQVMDYAPDIITYGEGAAPFFNQVLLQPLDRVDALTRSSVFPVIALKPICETHRVNELLDRFPRSRAIWIFRNYQDAVNSASVKWNSGREALRRLATDPPSAGWRSGGLSAQKLGLVKDLYNDSMSLHEANAVMWYLRNSLYFDLKADQRSDILLVQYEDLVGQPRQGFERMFDFLGIPLPAGFEQCVRSGKESRRTFPDVAPRIRTLCQDLHGRLVDSYSATAASTSVLRLANKR